MPDRNNRGNPQEADCPFFLSKRQGEALGLAAQGLTVLGIAQRLMVKPRTVRKHLRLARERLQALNTTHAVAIAVARKLIVLGE